MPTVLLVETDQRKRVDLTSRIEATPSSTVLAAVSDLANACLEVEHRNPDILIIASDLAILPEFDTPSALFRGLSVKCVLSCWARVLPSKVEAVARRNKFPVLRADLSTGKLEEILKHVQRSSHINSNQKRQIPMSTTLSNKGP